MSNTTYNKEYLGYNGFIWWMGVVEDINDPLKTGRVKVRCLEWHTEDKNEVPTDHLPWAQVMMPATSSSTSGVGQTPTGLKQGSWVVGFFLDGKHGQRPMVMGSIPGIPMTPSNTKLGFNDPDGKFPSLTQQPDTNRLGRNDENHQHPVIEQKNNNKTSSVSTALGGSWSEPDSPYNASYPHNHVMETESGHIKEYDDTTDNERIHEYHKTGTFYEIDKRGQKVTRVVANNYIIVAGNDYVNVKGAVNLTVDSNCKTYIKGNWDIQVDGNVSERIGGKYKRTVRGQTHISCGGDHKVDFNGASYTRYDGDRHTHTGADTFSRHEAGTNHSCPNDPPRTSGISCRDIDTAETT